MKYLKHNNIFERINPKEINDIIKEWEDPEKEEDDDKAELAIRKILDGTVYRTIIYFRILNSQTGSITNISLNDMKQKIDNSKRRYYGRYYGRMLPNKFVWSNGFSSSEKILDIDWETTELKAKSVNKNGGLTMVPVSGKKLNYSISPSVLFKGDELSEYYIRTNDILSFSIDGTSDGIMKIIKKNNGLINYTLENTFNSDNTTDKITKTKTNIYGRKTINDQIKFLLDNYDKVDKYLTKNKLKNDIINNDRYIKKNEKLIEELEKLSEIKSITKEELIQKVKNLKDKK